MRAARVGLFPIEHFVTGRSHSGCLLSIYLEQLEKGQKAFLEDPTKQGCVGCDAENIVPSPFLVLSHCFQCATRLWRRCKIWLVTRERERVSNLDWTTFEVGRVGPKDAFESLSALLFERWVVRTLGSAVQVYTLRGSGGDGGVEAFATLADGQVVGLQAKWFPENIDAGRIGQIRKSILTARLNHPTLTKYVITIPRNLTTGQLKKTGEKKIGELEKWNNLVGEMKIKFQNLEILRWDSHRIESELSSAENLDLRAVAFKGGVSFRILSDAWRRSKGKLRQRYLPDIHVQGLIEGMVSMDLLPKVDLERSQRVLEQARSSASHILQFIQTFRAPTTLKHSSISESLLDETVSEIFSWQQWLALRLRGLLSGPFAPSLPPTPLVRLEALLAETYSKGEWASSGAQHILHRELCEFWEDVQEVQTGTEWLEELFKPRMIIASGGAGKTHAISNLVQRTLDSGSPSLLIDCRGLDPQAGLTAALQTATDLPGWSTSQILNALEALAVWSQTQVPSIGPFIRTLIAIDGVEEECGWQRWEIPIIELMSSIANRPRLHLVVLLRPETAEEIGFVDTDASYRVSPLVQESNPPIPKLLAEYAREYQIEYTEAVPWLGWALRTPLEVRLFAEQFRGRTVSLQDGLNFNIASLMRLKLEELDRSARATAGNLAWSKRNELVHKVLSAICELSDSDKTPNPEFRQIAECVSSGEVEFDGRQIRLALEVLINSGLVDSINEGKSKGLAKPRQFYRLATRHVADYALALRLSESTASRVGLGDKVAYPVGLTGRPEAETLFVALLAEQICG